MTIEQANQYFAALPDGFASTEQLRTAFTAPVQKVQFVGVAGTAGKTVVARLLAAILSMPACTMPGAARCRSASASMMLRWTRACWP